jgi:hypothetical protein
VYANLSKQVMNRDSALGLVLVHVRPGFHQHQNDSEVRILRQRLRTPSTLALPRFLVAELLKFLLQVELQEWLSQLREPIQGLAAIAWMASAGDRGHGQHLGSATA